MRTQNGSRGLQTTAEHYPRIYPKTAKHNWNTSKILSDETAHATTPDPKILWDGFLDSPINSTYSAIFPPSSAAICQSGVVQWTTLTSDLAFHWAKVRLSPDKSKVNVTQCIVWPLAKHFRTLREDHKNTESAGTTAIPTTTVPTAALPTTAVPTNLGQPHRYGLQ